MRRQTLVLASALMLAACCSSSTAASHSPAAHSPSAKASASAPPTSAPFPSPNGTTSVPPVAASCTAPPAAGEKLVLVNLRSVPGISVPDTPNIGHPQTRCNLSGGTYFRFISATRLSYIVTAGSDQGAAGAPYIFDMTTGVTSLARAYGYGGFGSWAYAWSPDGSHLTYIDSDSHQDMKWHMLSAAGDKQLADLGAVAGRGASPDNDDLFVGFSADGQYVAVEQTFTPTPIRVHRVSDGTVAYTRTDGTMAGWAGSGARLYFRTPSGVQSWAPG